MKYFDDAYRGKRVLVTGHTGFKGSWLALWLKKLGAEVAGFSIDIPSHPSNFKLLDLEHGVTHYVGDIRDANRFAEAVDAFRPEIIFHLAAQALVCRSYADPAGTFATNVTGMVNLLDCVRARPWIRTTVLITSDKAYRNNEWCWGYRENDALGGHDPYSSSKSSADLIAQSYFYSYFRGSSTRLAITRAGNVIGGGDWADDRIVPDCIRAWSRGESVEIRSPLATRPWQHVLEPLGGYLWLGAKLQDRLEGINCEAFNFGPSAMVDQTVEQLLIEMTKYWPDAAWDVPKGNEASGREATLLKLSCDKALFHLQWTAAMDFAETVAFTVEWYRNWHQAKRDIAAFTDAQIDAYCQLALAQDAPWVRQTT